MSTKNNYLPKEKRVPDTQYQDLLKLILNEGEIHKPIHGEETRRITGHLMKFKRKNGFTMTPTRDLMKYGLLHGAMGENIAFMNGARTLEQLESFGCPKSFWEKWVTKEKCEKFGLAEGDLGPGSYGAAWANYPKPDGGTFNQISALVRMMKEFAMLRTILIDPWIPYFTVAGDPDNPRSVVVAPCHGWIHIHINTDTKSFKLEHKQRVTGLYFEEMVYYISDAHIYESQYEHARKLIETEPKIYPKVYLSDDAPTENIFDFRPHHFIVEEYEPHPWFKIPTPI
jgi:thymidylate synthase